MCDRHGVRLPSTPPLAPAPSTGRRKLWELAEFCHCAVLGTCLTIRELQKIGQRGGIRINKGASDYAIHGTFVSMVSDRPKIAKLLNKALDRKYRSDVDEAKRVKSKEGLLEYWGTKYKSGDVPGPFWAALTHPLADDEVKQVVYGDVHMLSHMVGAANRADLKRLADLEDANRSVMVELEEERLRSRQIVEQRNAVIAELRTELSDMPSLRGRIIALESQLSQYESETLVQDLTRNVERLEDEVARLQASHRDMETRTEELIVSNQALATEKIDLQKQLEVTNREADHLEALLGDELTSASMPEGRNASVDKDTDINLTGTTVIYVGGRSSQIRHFRELVERANGCLLHHDGGLEGGDTRLQQMLSRGDVVMCPLDCISHSACNRAKTYCKRAGKCFMPLRTSGLSSFVSGLQDVAKAN